QPIGFRRGESQSPVGEGVIVNRRTDGRRHMLPSLPAMEGHVWLETYTADCRIQLFEPSRRSDERAARTECRHKMRDTTGCLLPNLLSRSAIVRLPIRGIAVLVRVEIF